MKMERRIKDEGSFRDPSGHIFYHSGKIYRSVSAGYQADFDLLMSSGLYKELVEKKLLISHTDVTQELGAFQDEYKVLQPEELPFISYPYEWSFSMIKDAAFVTLSIMSCALNHGMILKDASAYNIQFLRGKPVFIDTLSFEKYAEGNPWVAYGQFCRHFLAPLSLASLKDIRLTKLLSVYLDGIPLELASELLPKTTRLKFGIAIHIHAHAESIRKSKQRQRSIPPLRFSKTAMLALVDSLESTIRSLKWSSPETEWAKYYENTNYSSAAFAEKERIVRDFLTGDDCETVIDLGANDGVFSRIASETGHSVISCDNDPVAVEKNYLRTKETSEERILPLIVDLLNPPPSCGWMNRERKSFLDRLPKRNAVLALALTHHFAIRENIPPDLIADWLNAFSERAIIEFIPKEDSQVREMLRLREDLFSEYSLESFVKSLSRHFTISMILPIRDSSRSMIINERKNSSDAKT